MPRERASSNTAVILFADIVDSTALTERMGDAAFRALARRLDAALRTTIRDCSGQSIDGKLLGDGVLAVFDSAQRAVECAIRCASEGAAVGLPLHLGVHAGDVIREANNVFGGAVNIAARIAAASGPGEVLVSDTVRSLARTSSDVVFEDRGVHDLKGIEEPLRLFRAQKRRGSGLSLASQPEPRSGRSRLSWMAGLGLAAVLLAASAAAGVLLALNVFEGDDGATHVFARTTLQLGDDTLLLDVARTDQEKRQVRLRDRSELAEGAGLLYDGVQPSTSWDTAGYDVPIDVVWIDAAKTVISVIADVPQGAGETDGGSALNVPADARYAVELNAGGAARYGIQAATQLTFYRATTIKLGDVRINAEVACTFNEQLSVGLAGRRSLAEDSALLYDWAVVAEARALEFSTWRTSGYLFSVDIVWLDDAKSVISVVPGVAPDTTAIAAPEGLHYTLELNSGAAERLGLAPGAVVAFEVPCDP